MLIIGIAGGTGSGKTTVVRKIIESLPAGQTAVTAPMPGNILDIKVNVGDTVNADDVVIILEAMKMQNIITATHRGRISRLCVKTGQIVGKDEILAEIKL